MAGSGDGKRRREKEGHYRRAAILHPLRQRILRQLLDGRELSAAEIAVELDEALGPIAYHTRVLVKREALKTVAQERQAPPRLRVSEEAEWAREMLDEDEE